MKRFMFGIALAGALIGGVLAGCAATSYSSSVVCKTQGQKSNALDKCGFSSGESACPNLKGLKKRNCVWEWSECAQEFCPWGGTDTESDSATAGDYEPLPDDLDFEIEEGGDPDPSGGGGSDGEGGGSGLSTTTGDDPTGFDDTDWDTTGDETDSDTDTTGDTPEDGSEA